MARSLGTMVIHLGLDATGLTRGSQKAQEVVANLKSKVDGLGAKLSAALGGLGAVGLASWGLRLAGEAQIAQASFETMIGSVEGATQMISDLRNLAAETPLSFAGLQENTTMLLAFGVAADQILPSLQMLGDIAGGEHDKMQRLALAFGQISAAGRLMGQDLLQLINAGFNPLQIIAQRTGLSMGDLKKKMEDGQISFQMVKEAFEIATSAGGRFHGRMDRMAETLPGRFAKLKDNASLAAMAFASELVPAAGRLIEAGIQLTDWLKSFDAAAVKNTVQMGVMAASFVAAMNVIPRIITVIASLIKAFRTLSVAQAVQQALSGPKGWATLAISLGVAVAAGAAVNSMLKEQEVQVSKSAVAARALVKENEELGQSFQALTAEVPKVNAELEKMKSRAEQIAEQMRTPMEVYRDTLLEANALQENGLISAEMYARYMAKANEELQQASQAAKSIQEATQGVGAAERYTMAGFSAVQSGMREASERRRAEEDAAKQRDLIAAAIKEGNEIAKNKKTVTLKQVTL